MRLMGNKKIEFGLRYNLKRCDYTTYICRVEECWSLSNVEYGLRTRQVILAHNPVIHSVLLSHNASSNKRKLQSWRVYFNWRGDRVWFMLRFYERSHEVSTESPDRVTLKAFQWTLSTRRHRIPVSVSPFQTDAKVIVFLCQLFRGKTRSCWLPVSPLAPCPPLSFNPVPLLSGMHFSHSFVLSLFFFWILLP